MQVGAQVAALIATLLVAAASASATRFGSYHEHIKNSLNTPNNTDDLDELVRLLQATNQTIYGLSVDGCDQLANLIPLLELTPGSGVSVFANVDSHEPFFEYCDLWLRADKSDMNWTAVGNDSLF